MTKTPFQIRPNGYDPVQVETALEKTDEAYSQLHTRYDELAARSELYKEEAAALRLEKETLSAEIAEKQTELYTLAEKIRAMEADSQKRKPDILAPEEPAVTESLEKITPAKRIWRICSNLFFGLICISLVLGSVLFAFSSDPNKNYFGYRVYNVLSESMTPRENSPPGGFLKGDVVIVRMVADPKTIKVGDIITFNPEPNKEGSTTYLTHRVVEVLDTLGDKEGIYFITKGDANNANDSPISGDMVIGKKVGTIPGVGGFLQLVRNHFRLTIATILCLFACIFMFRWYFAKPKPKPDGLNMQDTAGLRHPGT